MRVIHGAHLPQPLPTRNPDYASAAPERQIWRSHGRRSSYRAATVTITIQFFSYLKELVGVDRLQRAVPAGTALGTLHEALCREHPGLNEMRRSTLLAVGVDYQTRDHPLKDGDVVSLFPPVQGG